MRDDATENRRYAVTYAFERPHERDEDPLARIRAGVAALRREGAEVAVLAARQSRGADGRTEVTVRYRAASKGVLGVLHCRAGLPACGGPRFEGHPDAPGRPGRAATGRGGTVTRG